MEMFSFLSVAEFECNIFFNFGHHWQIVHISAAESIAFDPTALSC